MTLPTDEQIARFSAFVDEELDEDARAAFLAELDADPELHAAFEAFRATLGALAQLAPAPIPDVDLRPGFERKLRRRSQGRFYGERSLQRQRVQAFVFATVALGVLAGILLIASPQHLDVLFADDPNRGGSGEGTGALPEPSGASGTAPHEGESRAATVPQPTAFTHRARAFTVHTSTDLDSLESALRSRYGRAAVSRVDGAVLLDVPRTELAASVAALAEFGPVSHEFVPVAADATRAVIRFIVDAPNAGHAVPPASLPSSP